jgi:Bifunctional DNA primase/polymerase, N-terminal/AAA domain/Primase C terminal 1 (PriCT-1)
MPRTSPSEPVSETGASAPVLAEALTLAARGWPVFPCAGKRPRTAHGLHDAATDPVTIERWFEQPGANVGVRTGAESGLLVLDVDGEPGGDTLAALEREHGELPSTVECLTGGGGRHLYFSHPGQSVRNSAGKLGTGLDTRGDGGYVVCPPSVHESGQPYVWGADLGPEDVELAEPPTWLLELLTDPPSRNGSIPTDGDTIGEGSRNAALASLAGTMRKRGMSAQEIAAALRVTNATRCHPPLPDSEIETIVGSVARYDATEDSAPTFEVLTARATCELPDPDGSDELLGPLLMRGNRLVIGAHTGEGKTTIALQIVRAVTTSSGFLDWTGAGGRALIIDAEQGLRTIKRRLREAGLGESDSIDYIRAPDGLALDSNDAHVAAVAAVLEAGSYSVVVADPLYKLHTGDSNEERAAVDLMRRFDAWREQYRFALVLPVHCRKPPAGAKFSMHEMFGSTAYLRGAEVVVGLQRLRDGYSRMHFFKDRDGDLPIGAKWGLLFDRETGFRRDPEDENPKQNATEQVRELLEEQPKMTTAQLVAATGYADRTVRKALSEIGATGDRPGDAATAKLWSVEEDTE